jgi:anion-transporting  ArsA/GET3 family ATPase
VTPLGEIVASHSVVICAGSGGVGKTSTAAALAVHGAEQGRRTVVLTIDPARRLADALGLAALGNQPEPVQIDTAGSLDAMMLDQKGAWDRLVEHYAPSAEIAGRVLGNRFYHHLSESFAGSQEFMAVEQLAELRSRGEYDLIVVDTPPTQHALDFLEAPERIANFLDRRVIRWFVKPYFAAGWTALRVVNKGAGSLLRRLEDATGVSALMEVSDFFTNMSGLFEGFEERVQSVYRLFRSRKTAFVLVATPEEQVLAEARYFCRKMAELRVRLGAVVFNRVHAELGAEAEEIDLEKVRRAVARVISRAEGVEDLVQNFARYEALARGDARRMADFRHALPARTAVTTVPNFDHDLHDLDGLREMIACLVGTRVASDGE